MCSLAVCILKLSAPLVSIVVKTISDFTNDFKLYTVECTYSIFCTWNLQQCLQMQRNLNVHCSSLRAVPAYTAHVLGTCSVHYSSTVHSCVIWNSTLKAHMFPVIAPTTWTAPAMCLWSSFSVYIARAQNLCLNVNFVMRLHSAVHMVSVIVSAFQFISHTHSEVHSTCALHTVHKLYVWVNPECKVHLKSALTVFTHIFSVLVAALISCTESALCNCDWNNIARTCAQCSYSLLCTCNWHLCVSWQCTKFVRDANLVLWQYFL